MNDAAYGISRRLLADLTGCIAVGLLIAVGIEAIPYHAGGALLPFLIIYGVLLIPGYFWWIRMDREATRPRWLRQVLASIIVALAALAFDLVVGFALHPSLRSISDILSSSGILFGTTLLICPGYTFVALGGWARSLVQRRPSLASDESRRQYATIRIHGRQLAERPLERK